MIRFLKGKVKETLPIPIIEAAGIGYQVFCGSQLVGGGMVELWIHHHIREDRQELYGFIDKSQLQIFEMLLSVSGVGPKMALAICKNLETAKIEQAVIQSKIELLCSVPGVGKKIASKIVVELKSQLDKLGEVNLAGLEQSSEVKEALESLGYSQREIYDIIKMIPTDARSAQEQIAWAIRHIGKNN